MSLKNTFKDLLVESVDEMQSHFFRRDYSPIIIPGKVLAIMGVRRAGKSTLLKQIWHDLKKERRLDNHNLISVNFFDERLFEIKADTLGLIYEAHVELYPDISKETELIWMLDEIQLVKGWELFVSRIARNPKNQIFISGSSANLLSKELATAMRGRSVAQEVFPYSFLELVKNKKIDKNKISPTIRGKLRSLFRQYLRLGGFPEVQGLEDRSHKAIIQEYSQVLLLKDVIERHGVSEARVIHITMNLLMKQVGSLYSLNKLRDRLTSSGIKIAKETLSDWISWFEDCYLFFSVPLYTRSATKKLANLKKLYVIDNGLINATVSSETDQVGHLLENLVFLSLRRDFPEINYYRTKEGHEVDFVIDLGKNKKYLIQVCAALTDNSVKDREIRALRSAMVELKISKAKIITIDQSEIFELPEGVISVEPAWQWMLGSDGLEVKLEF